jgi:ketopantoate reductase
VKRIVVIGTGRTGGAFATAIAKRTSHAVSIRVHEAVTEKITRHSPFCVNNPYFLYAPYFPRYP